MSSASSQKNLLIYILSLILIVLPQLNSGPVSPDQIGLSELRANISALWAAFSELRAEVHESFDIHVAMENHEHHVHHLGHEDIGHDIHHSERHLKHLETVHGRTAAGPAGIEPHKPHTPEEKEVLRHEHEFHHANVSFETEEEHSAHHDQIMLRHLEVDHGHGEHNGIHHGKMNKELTHELDVHFMGQAHDDHGAHHSESLLRHLEEDDGHGPSLDRPTTTTTSRPARSRTGQSGTLTAYCEMKQNKALPRNTRHNIAGQVILTQPAAGGPLKMQINVKGIRAGAGGRSLHGFHIHESEPGEGNCNQAGSHYNPAGLDHGGPTSSKRHIGDFGNVESVEGQGINTVVIDHIASLSGPYSIMNRSLIIHEKEDDLTPTANAGRLLACCVIRAGSPPS